jgi:hypothetical protein
MLQLLHAHQVPTQGIKRTFRYLPWGFVLMALFMLGSGAFLGWKAWTSVEGWVWLLVAPAALLIAAIHLLAIYACVEGTVACGRPTNWLMKITEDGLYLRIHSYLNYHMAPRGPEAVFLPWGDIASMGRLKIVHETKPGRTKGYTRREQRLEIETRGLDTSALAAVVADDRARPAEGNRVVKSRARHVPVAVPRPGWISVEWHRGMLDAMPPAMEIRPPMRVAFNVDTATPAQIDDEIIRLIEADDRLGAVVLLRVARGMNSSQAMQLVNDLTQQLAAGEGQARGGEEGRNGRD